MTLLKAEFGTGESIPWAEPPTQHAPELPKTIGFIQMKLNRFDATNSNAAGPFQETLQGGDVLEQCDRRRVLANFVDLWRCSTFRSRSG